jgi:hypothetical protein
MYNQSSALSTLPGQNHFEIVQSAGDLPHFALSRDRATPRILTKSKCDNLFRGSWHAIRSQ